MPEDRRNALDDREREIFLDALDRPTQGEQNAFLEFACAGDDALRAAVEALLKNHQADTFLETPAADAANLASAARGPMGTVVVTAERPGDRIGRYKLLQEIGEGACGTVYMAEQEAPVRRRVALKIIKLGMDSKSVIARFEAERQAVALMDHPNIAKVFDAGTTETGRPFFVMELVRGIRITEYCDQNNLTARDRLDLFIKVCNAIQHAHQKGIIHRDIKPSNILVTLHDGVPVPKVIDFGIAKAIEQRLTDKTVFTHFQAFIGTPAYTSPEQAEMSGLDIDTRSDIYSLGVLLYELLTGKTPFDAQQLLESGLDEMRRIIREEEPLRPSTRLSTLGMVEATSVNRTRHARILALVQAVRGDLDWIVMKCLEKDRTRRYPTANALAVDLQRYLGNEPVLARPPTAVYRLQKFVRRNRAIVTTSTIVGLMLICGVILSTWLAIRATEAEREQSFAHRLAESARQSEVIERQRAQRERLDALRRAYTSDMNLVQQALAAKNFGRVTDLLDRQRPRETVEGAIKKVGAVPDFRQWEWRYFWDQSRSEAAFALPQQSNGISQVALSANGRLLVTSSDRGGRVLLWDVAARSEVAVVRHGGFGPSAFAFARDGARLALTMAAQQSGEKGSWNPGPRRSVVKIFTVATRSFGAEIPLEMGAEALAFTPDDAELVAFTRNGSIQRWNLETLQLVSTIPGPPGLEGRSRPSIVFSPDTQWLAVSQGGEAKIIDVRTGVLRSSVQSSNGDLFSLAFTPDGELLAAGPFVTGTSTSIGLFACATGKEVGEFVGHVSWVPGLTFTADGQRLISAGADQTVRIWDVAARKELVSLRGHLSEVHCVGVSSDGKTIVSGCKDGTLFGWEPEHMEQRKSFQSFRGQITDIEFFPDSEAMLSVNGDRTVSLWNPATLQEMERVGALTNITRLLLSPDGARVYAGTWDGQIKVLDWATRLVITNLASGFGHGRHPGPGGGGGPGGPGGQNGPISLADHGRTLVAAVPGGLIRLIDTASWQTKAEWKVAETPMFFAPKIAMSPDERFLAVGTSGAVELRTLATGALEATLPGQSSGITGLSFSPNSALLAASSMDGTVNLWDTAERKRVDVLRGHLLGVNAVTFSPDGERLATISHGNEAVKLWDVATRHEVATLAGQGSIFFHVKFSPDGRELIAINMQKSASIWRAPSREEIAAAEQAETRHSLRSQ